MVQCSHCGSVYDLGHGERVARYADCDVFKTPCCRRTVDTRPWKTFPDYRQLESEERALVRRAIKDGHKEARMVFEDGSCERFRLAAALTREQKP